MLNRYVSKLVLSLLLGLAALLPVHAQEFQPQINQYLREAKAKWNLTEADVANYAVSDQYSNAQSNLTYTYLQQQVHGLPIYNAVSTMALRDGQVVWFANRFHADAASRANAAVPALNAAQAVQAAAAHLGLTLLQPPTLLQRDDSGHHLTFDDAGIAEQPITVELMYVSSAPYPAAGQPQVAPLRLAWNVNLNLRNSPDWWNVRIDAANGAFLEKNNWTVSCDFGPHPVGSRQSTVGSPQSAVHNHQSAATENASNLGTYNVFALPLEAPSFGDRSTVTDPGLLLASPHGWHDNDGNDGAEYTITRGNNVYAYEDLDDDNQPGYSPEGGASLTFDFPLDLTQTPQSNRDAIITNLFYMNNMLHDVLYRHGFDEVSGNFQDNNYGRGGEAGDYVEAEAQDGGGTSNANFSTPADGQNGRMQMYLWPSGFDALLTVHPPSALAGEYLAVLRSGTTLPTPITNDVVLVDDATDPNPYDACNDIVNGGALTGRIALVDRGNCTFVDKLAAIEAQGAVAAIVVNNAATQPISMTAGNMPAIMVSKADGELLKAAFLAGETISVTIKETSNTVPDFDGSLDNGIVAHEYGHGLSTRLTGGPSNSGCLGNGEQGGEGWSDWLALIMTIEPGDVGANQRGIGTYVLDDQANIGIRRFPYSTNQTINPQTYGDVAGSTGVHAIGEIWAQTAWDLTWKLIDAEGFDPDWYNGTGGNNTAMRLVIEGMKLQPCGPGYLDARDAILAADELLFNNAHRCLIWEAFAGRGMGFDALQGSNDSGDETAGFLIPPFCQTAVVPPTASFTVNATSSCNPDFKFTDHSTDIPQEWLWDFGDGTTSTAISPAHTYAAPGTYTVVLTVTNTLGSSSDTLAVTYEPLPVPSVTANTTVCAGSPATLTADVLAGNTAIWSTADGNLLASGTTFTTPALQTATTYLVRQADGAAGKVGPVDNTFGAGANHNTGFEGRLIFEAFQAFRLVSVRVYAQGAGNRTINLYDANDNVVQSVTIDIPDGTSRVELNIDVPGPGEYSIGSSNLFRNAAGATYPYVLPGIVSINTSNATTSPATYYYYFYDWEVSAGLCRSEPVPVTVDVLPAPAAAFTATADGLDVTVTNTTTGPATAYSWDFGDGATSTEQEPAPHTYAANGTYTITLTVTNGTCTSTSTQTVTVETIGTHNPADAFGLAVFPNPASRSVTVALQRPISGTFSVELIDVTGRVVASTFNQAASQVSIDVANLPAGVYNVRVTTDAGTAVRKLTVAR